MFERLVSTRTSQKPLAIGISLLLLGGFLAGVAPSSALEAPLNGTAPTIHDPQPSGGSWVEVPVSQRLYAEDFGDSYDDDSFFSIPTGVECEGVSGPMLVIGTGKNCTYAGTDTAFRYSQGRNGAIDIGFEINFFGDTFDSLFPSENGAVFFSEPNTDYNYSILSLSANSESSGMYPLAMDLYFNKIESNFWVAQTTVDTNPAFVMSWENLDPCCNDSPTPGASTSFQLALIDLGGGDFDAYFNYANFIGMDRQGYRAPQFAIDLSTTSVGDTSVRFDTLEGFPAEGCVAMEGEETLGNPTDTVFEGMVDDDFFAKLLDATTKTVSLFTDVACLNPIEIQQTQSIDVDRHAYEVVKLAADFRATAIGWGTYSEVGKINATELRQNMDNSRFLDGTDSVPNIEALNRASYRTTVPGRFVIGQRDGGTVGDPATGDPKTVSAESSSVGKTYGPTEPRPVYTNKGGLTVSNENGDFLENYSLSTENEHYLYGPDWNFSAYSVFESGSGRLPLAIDGSLKLRTKGSVALRGTGYEPKAKISVYAMPSATKLGTVRATKAGNLKSSNFKIPTGAPLGNTHIQVIGKSRSDEVRFKTFSVVFYDRSTLAGAYSDELSSSQKANLRKMAYRATGETIVTCRTLVPEAGSTDLLGSAAAKNACQYLASQYPELTIRVREITSSKVSKTKVKIVFSR